MVVYSFSGFVAVYHGTSKVGSIDFVEVVVVVGSVAKLVMCEECAVDVGSVYYKLCFIVVFTREEEELSCVGDV